MTQDQADDIFLWRMVGTMNGHEAMCIVYNRLMRLKDEQERIKDARLNER